MLDYKEGVSMQVDVVVSLVGVGLPEVVYCLNKNKKEFIVMIKKYIE